MQKLKWESSLENQTASLREITQVVFDLLLTAGDDQFIEYFTIVDWLPTLWILQCYFFICNTVQGLIQMSRHGNMKVLANYLFMKH